MVNPAKWNIEEMCSKWTTTVGKLEMLKNQVFQCNDLKLSNHVGESFQHSW